MTPYGPARSEIAEPVMKPTNQTEIAWDGVAPRSFKLAVPAGVLTDLNERLDRTRWPDEVAGAPWQYGTDLRYLRDLCAYWRDQYDWRAHERTLNQFDHYRVSVGDVELHYVLEQGEGRAPRVFLAPGGSCLSVPNVQTVQLTARPASRQFARRLAQIETLIRFRNLCLHVSSAHRCVWQTRWPEARLLQTSGPNSV